jgi:shikimate kinase
LDFDAVKVRCFKILLNAPEAVIATGGGAVVSEENRTLMANSGLVVYLDVSLEQQMKRTGSGEGRPLLQCGDQRGDACQADGRASATVSRAGRRHCVGGIG